MVLSKIVLLVCLVALAACQGLPEVGHTSGNDFASEKGFSLKNQQTPWILTLSYVPEKSATPSLRINQVDVVADSVVTTTFKLRLKSQDPQVSIPELLQVKAPHIAPEQQQNLLFYHMAEVVHLQLDGKSIRPATAYVEMSTQRAESLDIIFVFALPKHQLHRAASAAFVLDNAFFLEQPVQFGLGARLQAVT